MEKFTQGEWYVSDEDCDSVTTSIVTESVCYINKQHSGFKANAHIIAAAPDMYRALVNITSQSDVNEVDWNKVHEALAKARGEVCKK